MKIGASARGNNDIDLFRRPAGLADGLALKEPALPRSSLRSRFAPTKLVPPSPGIPPGVRLGRALYKVRRRTQSRDRVHFGTFRRHRAPRPLSSWIRHLSARDFSRPRCCACAPRSAGGCSLLSCSVLTRCGGGATGATTAPRDRPWEQAPVLGRGRRRGAGRDRARLPGLRDEATRRGSAAPTRSPTPPGSRWRSIRRARPTRPGAVTLVDADRLARRRSPPRS